MTVNAKCECGKCEFRVDGDPSYVFRCHCADCRRVGGEDYFHVAIFPAAQARTLPHPTLPLRADQRHRRPAKLHRLCHCCTPLTLSAH